MISGRATLLLLLGLVPWPGRAGVAQTLSPRPEIEVGDAFVRLDTLGRAVPVAAAGTAAAFGALHVVYAELRIPLTLLDSAGGVIGNVRLIKTQSFAGTTLSRLLDCGQAMNGPFADNARVVLSFASFVSPGPRDSVLIRTGLFAQAVSIDGSSREPVTCTSTGFFETRIARAVAARAQAADR